MRKPQKLSWSDQELAASVEAYVFMLRLQRESLPYSEAAAAKVLLAGPLSLRNDASFRYRMRNISAVVRELQGPALEGFPPAEKVGAHVRDRLRALLVGHVGFQEVAAQARAQASRSSVLAPPDRAEALRRLDDLRASISELERELLGVGHNRPPEPLMVGGLNRADFEQARQDVSALADEVKKVDPDPVAARERAGRLLDFALKVAVWAGARATKFTDAALGVLAPIAVAKATGILPSLVEALSAAAHAIGH